MTWCPLPGYQPGLRDVIMATSLLRTLHILMVLLILSSRVRPLVQDQCDTTVWDMGNKALGVRDVVGSCAEGHIDWRVPYGAIRVSLQPNLAPNQQPTATFEICFISSAYYTTVKFFLDDMSTSLKPLTVLTSGRRQMTKELCFQSEGDAVVLYVESELDSQSAAQGLVKIDYDIRKLPHAGQRQSHDCRPCREDEILEAVCNSDLVFSGSMDLVTHNPQLGESSLHLKVTKMIRQHNDIFNDPHKKLKSGAVAYPRLKFHTENGVVEWPEEEVPVSAPESHSSQSDGTIIAPHRCGIRKGHGEFMFLARTRFKRAFLHCAPRLDVFSALWARAQRTGRAQCTLD